MTLVIGLATVLVVAGVTRWLGSVEIAGAPGASAAARGASDLVRFVFVLTCAAGAIWWLVLLFGGRHVSGAPQERQRRTLVESLLSGLIVLAIVLLAFFLGRLFVAPRAHVVTGGGRPHPAAAHPVAAGTGSTDWPVILGLVIGVVVVGLVAALWTRRPGGRTHSATGAVPPPPAPAGSVAAWSDGPAPDPMTETDPRQAVLAAYRRLMVVFGQHGLARRRSEAPFEHLDRVLTRSPDALVPARSLARAFEVARFSDHEISVATRDEVLASFQAAVRALDSVRP